MLRNEVQILFELNHCDVTARPGHWLGLLVPGSHGARIQMPIQVRHGPIWATGPGLGNFATARTVFQKTFLENVFGCYFSCVFMFLVVGCFVSRCLYKKWIEKRVAIFRRGTVPTNRTNRTQIRQ